MLNGIDPIIIFNFSKAIPNLSDALSSIPIVSGLFGAIPLPPIPIYLSRQLTGIVIDAEEKSLEIETNTETLTDGDVPDVNQKGINSTIRISMRCQKDTVALTLLSAMVDVVFEKVTSKEYSITYLNKSTIIFNGLLHSFNINHSADNSLAEITMEITKPSIKAAVKKTIPVVPGSDPTAIPLVNNV